MEEEKFISLVKRQVAEIAVGASALRNQGAKGLVKTARDHFFETVDLEAYGKCKTEKDFQDMLDKDTKKLRNKFPENAQHWGAARKAMNLFLRDAFYNRYLCDYYTLTKIEKWLEVPLDNDVASGLLREHKSLPKLPKWTKIKALQQIDSMKFQKAASDIGQEEGIYRVHLDLRYWRQPSKIP